MPTSKFSREWYNQYEARNLSSSAKPKPLVRHEPLAAVKGKEGDAGRVHVRIASYRTRLIDADNLCGKWFTDSLRFAGYIGDDSAAHITFQIEQFKVKSKNNERTELEIITPNRIAE